MKEYEKLAENVAEESVTRDAYPAFCYGFKEGFIKAKEMAIDLIPNIEGVPFHELENLGEKEI